MPGKRDAHGDGDRRIRAGADYGMAERQKTQPAIAIGSLDAAALQRFGQVGIAGEQPPAGGLDVVVDTVAVAGVEHFDRRRWNGGVEHAVFHRHLLGDRTRRSDQHAVRDQVRGRLRVVLTGP